MKCNIGKTDKIVRFIIGIALIIVVGVFLKSWWGLIGLVPILTVFTGRCLFYYPFHINTIEKKESVQQ